MSEAAADAASAQGMDTTSVRSGVSNASLGSSPDNNTGGGVPTEISTAPKPMTEDEQVTRRAAIRKIMSDPDLTAGEKSRAVQKLMDGRRRGSGSSNKSGTAGAADNVSMMAAAAMAAADFYDSSDDDLMLGPEGSVVAGDGDDISLASSFMTNTDDEDEPSRPGSTRGRSRPSSRAGSRPGSRASSRGAGSRVRLSRSASLKNFAEGAAAAAAAAAAALEQASDDPHDVLIITRRMEKSRPYCDHYDRECTIISPCCGLAFGCRICHDECPILPPPRQKPDPEHWADDMDLKLHAPKLKRSNSMPTSFHEEEATHHQIDRFAIEEIICRQCYTRQSSKTDNCVNCGLTFGEYHCHVCNLWMSKEERPYHCEECGFCRVGGKENFRHCQDCGMCIDSHVFDDHNCKAGKYMSDCPVCQEDLFSSRSASHEMPCGHAIHWHCFQELTSFDSRCPVCKKTAETREHMASTWEAMAVGIALQPVPPEMARVVNITCNDCEQFARDRRWHFLGVQCQNCSSFNTTVEQTTLVGRGAAAFLGDQQEPVGLAEASSNRNNGEIENMQESMGNLSAMEESSSSFADTEHLTAAQQRNLHAHLMTIAGFSRGAQGETQDTQDNTGRDNTGRDNSGMADE